jgi:RarD protein
MAGIFLLSEKADKMHKIAIFIMICAILIKFIGFGNMPITTLMLAATSAPYCLVRKKINVHPASAIFMEMLIMFPFLPFLSSILHDPTLGFLSALYLYLYCLDLAS